MLLKLKVYEKQKEFVLMMRFTTIYKTSNIEYQDIQFQYAAERTIIVDWNQPTWETLNSY